MKTLQRLCILIVLITSTIGYSQEKSPEKKVATTIKQEVKIDSKKLKKFVGKYNLAEANLELEIIQENNNMFIKSPWGKDPLTIKDENTLIEPTRGVHLSIIKDNTKALKYFQNGYETTLERINSKAKK